MNVEIIAVGTELLAADCLDTNSVTITRWLQDGALRVRYRQQVMDQAEDLQRALSTARERADLIFVCGGLGPTDDDITKTTVAAFLGVDLVPDPIQHERLITDFESRVPARSITERDLRQVLTLKGGETILNLKGLACGCYFRQSDHDQNWTYVLLPGPPRELAGMLTDSLRDTLMGVNSVSRQLSLYFNFVGLGESQLADHWADFSSELLPSYAIYARPNKLTIRVDLSSSLENPQAAEKRVLSFIKQADLEPYYIGTGWDQTLERYLIDAWTQRGITVSCAESLTAGLVMSRLAEVPGASAVFKGGVVSYQTELKERLLEVDRATIDQETVVSEAVARQMAEGVRSLTQSDWAVSLTGVAGPGPSQGQPAGTVCLGLSTPNGLSSQTLRLAQGDRNEVRQRASQAALVMLKLALADHSKIN